MVLYKLSQFVTIQVFFSYMPLDLATGKSITGRIREIHTVKNEYGLITFRWPFVGLDLLEITGNIVIRENEITGNVVIGETEITGNIVIRENEITGNVVIGETEITGNIVIRENEITGNVVIGD
ncbi:hypothetical protein CEXT_518461 [Caerostris extrusa]|uniref:Polymer-forming cytoskeletal protein n=1 Tax=Caerostris extrusa TaxID=172846 RepID=A0AAV4TZP0_CAEEX|nr:hypothetical protein CEXT_518461 [Caerostris extrusa]